MMANLSSICGYFRFIAGLQINFEYIVTCDRLELDWLVQIILLLDCHCLPTLSMGSYKASGMGVQPLNGCWPSNIRYLWLLYSVLDAFIRF